MCYTRDIEKGVIDVLNIYVRGHFVTEENNAILGAFGIREDHVAIRYAEVVNEKLSDKLTDGYAVLKVLEWLSGHPLQEEVMALWNTDKILVKCINGKRKPSSKKMAKLVDDIRALMTGIRNIEMHWIPFEHNLANLMINQVLTENKREHFTRRDIDSLDNEQLRQRIKDLEKENLQLHKRKQALSIGLAKYRVYADILEHELNEQKALVDQYSEEQKIVYMLSTPPTSLYVH